MKREFLEGLELDKETIDTIMAEHGKTTQGLREKNETLTQKLNTYETEIKSLQESSKDTEDWKSKFENLDKKIKEQEAEEQAKKEDETLTNNIITAFGDKKFTSDYVKNGLIADIKAELSKAENKGKGIKEIFDSLTKDKQGIFENPNKPTDMPGTGNSNSSITKETFNKMPYMQRVSLKQENPELYQELSK